MSALKSLNVSFEKNMDVFQAGQVVRGQVEVELSEDMEARGVNITLKGKARCMWVIYTGQTSIVYTGNQLYFDNTETLWGPGLPTSYEGCHGGVRYYAKATIDRPNAFDKTLKKYFTVLDMYDLNEDPDATKLGVWPFASDPIEVHLQTDRGAYCPGEVIRLSGVLKNGSGTDIKETTVQLRQEICP
ncbi:arrestin domain-containing protein 3-like [Branchiostoma floridae x Branchiostoma japonicum]